MITAITRIGSIKKQNVFINEACSPWIKTIQHQLDNHAPVKSRRVKHKRLPEWCNQEILTTRKLRDISERHGNWPDYKKISK